MSVLFIVAGLVFLIFGGDFFVRGASRLATGLGISQLVIGLTVVAFGTSAPELAVSLSAALQGSPDIALANVIGSNIFNTFLILGLSAVFVPLAIHSSLIKREIPILVGASLLLFVFGEDGRVSQLESSYLALGILGYTSWLVFEAKLSRRAEMRESEQNPEKAAPLGIAILQLIGGLAGIAIGARWLVSGASEIALAAGVSEAVIGATIVATGTSLPELVTSVVAAWKGERDIAIGNVIGSNIFNILAIVGISGSLLPGGLALAESLGSFDIYVMMLSAALCVPFFANRAELGRKEALLFLVLFALYIAKLVMFPSWGFAQ